MSGSQKPPKHSNEQHWPPLVQRWPSVLHTPPSPRSMTPASMVTTCEQVPLVQVPAQHGVAALQVAPGAAHGVVQLKVFAPMAVHWPRQQLPAPPSGAHAAPVPRHVSAPKTQRGLGRTSLSQTPQQVVPPPEVQVSPVGRQLVTFTLQRPLSQRWPQQSTFAAQFSPDTLQSAPPQRPLLQASEQHSSARVQATPSPKQAC